MTAAGKEAAARLEALARLQHQYDETKNPLYVWEAIACCLLADNPLTIPDWCLNYLRKAATNICRLSCGRDFHYPESKLSTDQAFGLVAGALLLSEQGQRNAFARLLKDRDDQVDANSDALYRDKFYREVIFKWTTISHKDGEYFVADVFRGTVLEQIAKRRSVTKDRAKRIVARGKSLLRQGLKRKRAKPLP
jgi:hypothetical protein